MPAIITDTFDYNDIVRVLDLDEAFVFVPSLGIFFPGLGTFLWSLHRNP